MAGKFGKLVSMVMAIVVLVVLLFPNLAFADQYDDFIAAGQQHNIISNEHFINYNSMSVADIQAFLVQKNSYLKDYVDTSSVGVNRSAAQIIYDAAHGLYDAAIGTARGVTIDSSTGTINPAVIMVFLQKEQSLISRTYRDDNALDIAMGYACPSSCDPAYYGFAMQVGWGAWQLRYNYEIAAKDSAWWNSNYPSQTHYYVGNTVTMNTSRKPPDNYQVTLSNQATASCYRYTPYVFFGNFNVWNLFYNTYDLDNFSSLGTNDTTSVSLTTYDSSVVLSGTKRSDMKLYFNNQEITGFGPTSWLFSFILDIGAKVYYITYGDDANTNQALKHIHVERHRLADIDGDNQIGIADLAIFAENWGVTNPGTKLADLNGDSVVNIADLAIFAENWGR